MANFVERYFYSPRILTLTLILTLMANPNPSTTNPKLAPIQVSQHHLRDIFQIPRNRDMDMDRDGIEVGLGLE